MSAVMSEAPRLRVEDSSPQDEYAAAVGRRIRVARKELGMTQVEFAQKVGVSQRAAQSWETGEVIPYRWTKKIARIIKREPDWILHGDERLDGRPKTEALERLETKVDELTQLLRSLSKKIS